MMWTARWRKWFGSRRSAVGWRLSISKDTENADLDEFNHKLEILHDPTHVRSYTATRWRSIFKSSGLKVDVLKDRLSERPQGTTVRRCVRD